MDASNPVLRTYCTTREAAQLLGVSVRTAQLWAESGLLEAWKTDGGHRRITRQSIERLVHSRQGELPIATTQTVGTSDGAERAVRILVVEDSVDLRRIYRLNLTRWPFPTDVASAADGYEALVRIGQKRPDLLVADLQMPGMDGFRMLRTIGAIPDLHDMAIVVATGLDPAEIARRGGLPNGIPVLTKPIDFDRLRGIAESVHRTLLADGSPPTHRPHP